MSARSVKDNLTEVLVVFGGMVGFSSDDINKFLWMVRISGGVYPEVRRASGCNSPSCCCCCRLTFRSDQVVETDYFNSRGEYRIDHTVSDRMKNSLMYQMCYYRFGDVKVQWGQEGGFDRVRNAVIGHKDIKFRYLEEAFTSEHWMVRIYRVKEPDNIA